MTYPQAIRWLQEQIPHAVEVQFPGARGLERTRELLKLLGEPQNQLRVIHVAGTSGKGSTAYLIARLLQAHGFRVGLSIKPYIFDVRERFQVNDRLLAKSKVAAAIERVRRAAEQLDDQATYFEVVTSLMFLLFSESKLDYAVVETGVGGTYDATNVIDREDKLAVLTRIGLDHEHILGRTVTDIATQKSGIIGRDNQVLALEQSDEITHVFRRRAGQQRAHLVSVDVETRSQILTVSREGTVFRYHSNQLGAVELKLRLLGTYQRENAVLALAAVEYLAHRDLWYLVDRSIKYVSRTASLPAHFDIRHVRGKTIVIDGAHNPQKMEAFLASLRTYFPHDDLNCLVSFKRGKDARTLLGLIEQEAKRTIVTNFTAVQDTPIRSEDCHRVIQHATEASTLAIPDAARAFELTMKQPGIIVVTGSVYFAALLYPMLDRDNHL